MPSMINRGSYRWVPLWYAMLMVCVLIKSAMITVRVRLPTGNISRLRLSNDSSISELCDRVKVGTDYVPQSTDIIRIRDYYSNFSIAMSNASKLVGYGVRDGDLIDLSSAGIRNSSSGANTTNHTTRRVSKNAFKQKKDRSGSLADLEKRRAGMARITRELPDPNLRVVYHLSAEPALQRIAANTVNSGGMALLMGRFENKSNSVGVDGGAVITAEVYGAFEIGTSVYDAAAGLHESHVFCIEKALSVVDNLGLDVVGVALGSTPIAAAKVPKREAKARSPGTKKDNVSLLWRARHVHFALQARATCRSFVGSAGLRRDIVRDPFMILSVAQEPEGGTEVGTKTRMAANGQGRGNAEAKMKVRVEAFRLSAQALQLHQNGTLPTVASSRAQAEGDMVHLSAPILGIGGADDTTVVDSALLCMPVAICSAPVENASAGASAQAMQHVFPSMTELQSDPVVAEAARQFLLKLLGSATQPLRDGEGDGSQAGRDPQVLTTLSRFRDPQLLLYLSAVMEPAAFKMLCQHLRVEPMDSGSGAASPAPQQLALPLEVLVALEQVRQSLL